MKNVLLANYNHTKLSTMKYITLTIAMLSVYFPIFSQVNYTANDQVPILEDQFRYGVTPGYYPTWNQDTFLGNIAAGNPEIDVDGVGITAFRAAMPEWFVEIFGYDIRVSAFEHYKKLGMDNHTIFLESPIKEHLEDKEYCEGEPSLLFENMYLDIWDNGENGTPINDDNLCAVYYYNTVMTYKDYVKFWEIWNEPDFTMSPNAYAPLGTPGNWWENDPDPCDLQIKTPIYNYVRMLRIAYEVIKTVDPTAYIAIGGIGFPSFLHAVLRNTDNPEDGSVTTDYPLNGGAYFDVLSYHVYPHIDGCYREWSNEINDFVYKRHSDAAAECIVQNKNEHEEVLYEFGYDGTTYPEKLWILTEANVPRKGIGPYENNYGNDRLQRNWVIKALVLAQLNDVRQVHLFKLGEGQDYETATEEFELMGLFKNLNAAEPYTQEFTDQGIAHKTMSQELSGWTIDKTKTAAMQMPSNINGAAFANDDGDYKYVLWAKTVTDKSEAVNATYTFPASFGIDMMLRKRWVSSVDGSSLMVGSENLILSSEPMFFEPVSFVVVDEVGAPSIIQRIYPNPAQDIIQIEMNLPQAQQLDISISNLNGQVMVNQSVRVPANFHKHSLNVANLDAGIYMVKINSEQGQQIQRVIKAE